MLGFPDPKQIKNLIKSIFDDTVNTAFNRSKNLDISTFRNKFLGSNARSYLFLCKIQFPGMQNVLKSGLQTGLSDISNIGLKGLDKGLMSAAGTAINISETELGTEDFKYFVKSTSLPESTLEETATYWCGQQYKLSSVRRSQDWSVVFLVNDDASVIRKFWDWQMIMHNPESNNYGKPVDYMTDITVQLLGIDGYPICTYKLFGAWPKTIGSVELDYSNNEFATIEVTFSYQYHTVSKSEELQQVTAARSAVRAVGLGGVIDMVMKK